MVVILDLGLGQGGLLHRRPHHGLGPLIERAVHHQLHELGRDDGLGVVIHRQIGPIPGPGHAQALELLALDVDPFIRKAAAFLAELDHVDRVLVAAFLAVFLLDLPFDRQAVTVPARHIARIETHHLVRPHDDVLDGLVQRVADMQMPVGIGRAVMQHERLAPRRGRPQAVIDADARPPLQPFGFARGQARTHRKLGLGQKDGIAVIGLRGVGHRGVPLRDVRTRLTRRRETSRHRAANSRSERRKFHPPSIESAAWRCKRRT